MKEVLKAGAVWNATYELGNSSAEIALSLNDLECYELIQDAGRRSASEFALRAFQSIISMHVLRAEDNTAAGST